MTRPSCAMCSSVGRMVPSKTRLVASKTAVSRFDSVSSGPTMRKFVGFSLTMSRSSAPATRVAWFISAAGFLTSTA